MKSGGQNQNIKTDNKFFGYVISPNFQDQNYVHEEIKSRLHSRNACYRAFQSILSSRLLFKNTKFKMCIIIQNACFATFFSDNPIIVA